MTDADLFEAFVRRYQDMVFATAVRLLGNPAEAEDVAQTVFLRAFQRFDEIGASPAAAGWLKTVARNTCLNYLSRYRARWRFFSELARPDADTTETDAPETYAGRALTGPARNIESSLISSDSPAQDLEQAEQREQLEQALRGLPDHQRVPLVLFHFENTSYQDIAALLGVSVGKVKTDIHRGREALRRQLSTDHATR
jgi:RNA polymerase sigma-70 factor (ECF subfamily)